MIRKAIALGMLLTLTATAHAQDKVKVDERRAATADATIEIGNVAGSVEVVGGGDNGVHVTGMIGADHELVITGNERRMTIEVKLPRTTESDANIKVQLPKGCRVTVNTVSADITASNLVGTVQLESVSGNVTVKEGAPTLKAQSVSGKLVIDAPTTTLVAETVSGDIVARRAATGVTSRSVSGNMKLIVKEIRDGAFESVSGDITVDGDLISNGKLQISAHSGSTSVSLPASTSAKFRLTTFNGDIRSEFGSNAKNSRRSSPGQEQSFTTGSGGGLVSIESFSGDITLNQK